MTHGADGEPEITMEELAALYISMSDDDRAAFAYLQAESGTFAVFNRGVTDDGESTHIEVIARIVP